MLTDLVEQILNITGPFSPSRDFNRFCAPAEMLKLS